MTVHIKEIHTESSFQENSDKNQGEEGSPEDLQSV